MNARFILRHTTGAKCAAGLAPAKNQAAISEFGRVTEHELVKKLNLVNLR